MVEHLRSVPGHVVVALCGVSGPENVGGLLRTVAGFGGAGALLDAATCDPFVRRAARVSMGAVFHLPIWRVDDMAEAIVNLRERCGTRSVAAHLHPPYQDVLEADLSGNLLLALGSEADGLPADVSDACDARIRIAMDERWDCLNVGTAGAILLWEIARRRA